jgi:hypothetical protein
MRSLLWYIWSVTPSVIQAFKKMLYSIARLLACLEEPGDSKKPYVKYSQSSGSARPHSGGDLCKGNRDCYRLTFRLTRT